MQITVRGQISNPSMATTDYALPELVSVFPNGAPPPPGQAKSLVGNYTTSIGCILFESSGHITGSSLSRVSLMMCPPVHMLHFSSFLVLRLTG